MNPNEKEETRKTEEPPKAIGTPLIGMALLIVLFFGSLGVIIFFSNYNRSEFNGATPTPQPSRTITNSATPLPSATGISNTKGNTATPRPSQTTIGNTKTPTPQPTRTTDTNTGTPTPTPENLADRIRAAMPKGNVVYDPPASMNLEDTKLVNLILGPAQTVEELVKMIPDKQDRQILNDRIQWYGYMQAEMTGTDFDITPVTSAKQLVSQQETTKWSWSIKPKKPGKQKLYLTLYALVDEDGAEKPLVIRPFDPKEISVDVTLYQRAGLFLTTVGSHMEWVLTAIIGLLIPFALWFRKRAKDKDAADAKDIAEQKNTPEAADNIKTEDIVEAKDKTDEPKDKAEPVKPKKPSKRKPRQP